MVALRKESVDRNNGRVCAVFLRLKSLSARRAWIEIYLPVLFCKISIVALRKESVDRNNTRLANIWVCICRSPQGERG